jgi:hypothetical protein
MSDRGLLHWGSKIPFCSSSNHLNPRLDGLKLGGIVVDTLFLPKHQEKEYRRCKHRLLKMLEDVEHPQEGTGISLTINEKQWKGTIITSFADSMTAIHCFDAFLQIIMEETDSSGSGGSLRANVRWMWSCVS